MRSLPVSLLLVIVVAIFSVGYVLDSMFERYSNKPAGSVAQISSFGQGFANMLNRTEHPNKIVAQWSTAEVFSVRLVAKIELPLPDSLQVSFESGEPLILESEQALSIHYILPQHDMVLIVQSNQIPIDDRDRLAWLFTSVFYLGTLAVVVLWLKPLTSRLRLLRSSTKAFGAGNLESRVRTQGVTYIQDIEMDFNRMADQIQQLIEDNKLLTSAVSHDLRTPLARLRFGIDTFKETSSSTGRDQYLTRINSDLNEMEALVDSHLQFARLDNVMDGIEKEALSLRDLLGECAAQFYDSDAAIKFDEALLNIDDSIDMLGCIEHLATLFNNLFQNAIKYANKSITVELHRDGLAIEITISDDGPGIEQKQRQLLMKPFERGEGAAGTGYGLGLAVASRIAKHHKGEILIGRCEKLGGARITVRLMQQ